MRILKLTKDPSKIRQDSLSDTMPVSSIRLQCFSGSLAAFGTLDRKKNGIKYVKWNVSVAFSDLLDDPSVLIEGVLFRARYLGSTQLVCEGQPTKSTRMCQAEEAVSRIKVYKKAYFFITLFQDVISCIMFMYMYIHVYTHIHI